MLIFFLITRETLTIKRVTSAQKAWKKKAKKCGRGNDSTISTEDIFNICVKSGVYCSVAEQMDTVESLTM